MHIHSALPSPYPAAERSGQAQQPVGLESAQTQATTFKPVSQAAKSDASSADDRSKDSKRNASDVAQENQEKAKRVEKAKAEQQAKQEQQVISRLATRDREVRAHEQAHVAAGGQYAGGATYQFERGPNGVNYAVSGEVSISVGPAATPEETLRKAQTVKRAALAPAEPSPQDRRVAAQAAQLEAQARAELAEQRRVEAEESPDTEAVDEASEADETSEDNAEKQAAANAQQQVNEGSQPAPTGIDPQVISSLIDRVVDDQATSQFLQRLAVERSYNTEPAGNQINTVA